MISAKLIKIIASCVASFGIIAGTYFLGTPNKNLNKVPQETSKGSVVEKANEEVTLDKSGNDVNTNIQERINDIPNSNKNESTTQNNNVTGEENTKNPIEKNNENLQSNNDNANLDKGVNNNQGNVQENKNGSIEDRIKNFNNNSSSNSMEGNVTSENTPSVGTNKDASTNDTANSSAYIAEIEQLIFQKVNEERTKAGLSQLSYNNTMEYYARLKSKDMGDRGYFNHANPEGQYITDQMRSDKVSYTAWGENIAYISGVSGNSALADRFMTNWMNSSGHRANILSTNFTSIGVGVYKIGNTYYATQEFYK